MCAHGSLASWRSCLRSALDIIPQQAGQLPDHLTRISTCEFHISTGHSSANSKAADSSSLVEAAANVQGPQLKSLTSVKATIEWTVGAHANLPESEDHSALEATNSPCSLPQGQAPPAAARQRTPITLQSALQRQACNGRNATLRTSGSQLLTAFAQAAACGQPPDTFSSPHSSPHCSLVSTGPSYGCNNAQQPMSALLSVASTTASALRLISGERSPQIYMYNTQSYTISSHNICYVRKLCQHQHMLRFRAVHALLRLGWCACVCVHRHQTVASLAD